MTTAHFIENTSDSPCVVKRHKNRAVSYALKLSPRKNKQEIKCNFSIAVRTGYIFIWKLAI